MAVSGFRTDLGRAHASDGGHDERRDQKLGERVAGWEGSQHAVVLAAADIGICHGFTVVSPTAATGICLMFALL